MERDLDLIAEDLALEREAYERHMADELEAELRAERRAEPDIEMYPGGAGYYDTMGYND